MAARNAPWNWNEKVVGQDGKATPEFLAWLQQQLTTNQLVNSAVPQGRLINTGLGLTGGGDLTQDRTIALDAVIDDLNDVDTATSPPTDGQALVWNNPDGLWVPGDVDIQTLLDSITSTRGSILYRGASGWSALSPGSTGQFLRTNGTGADPAWATGGGGGGAGQSEAQFNYPDLTGWTTWYQKGTSSVVADSLGSTIVWQNGSTARSLCTSAPVSYPYNVYARIAWICRDNTAQVGLCLRQSSNNWHASLNVIPQAGNHAFYLQTYNGTTFSTNYSNIVTQASSHDMWFRIRMNAANSCDTFISTDGITWVQIGTAQNFSGSLTPDSMGIWMRTSTGAPMCRVLYFDTVAPTI